MKRSLEVRTGKWCREEDDLLKACIQKFGEGKWHLVPQRAGLKRCRKSCRLRWLNYLKPDINRGDFTEDEVDMMVRLHTLLGNRWALMAGRLPGRTPNDVKNYWNTNMRKKRRPSDKKELNEKAEELITSVKPHVHRVIRPRAFSFSRNSCWLRKKLPDHHHHNANTSSGANEQPQQLELEDSMMEWWKSLLDDSDDVEKGISEQQNALLSLSSSSSSSSNSMSKQEGNHELLWDEQFAWINEFPLDTNLCDFLSN